MTTVVLFTGQTVRNLKNRATLPIGRSIKVARPSSEYFTHLILLNRFIYLNVNASRTITCFVFATMQRCRIFEKMARVFFIFIILFLFYISFYFFFIFIYYFIYHFIFIFLFFYFYFFIFFILFFFVLRH